MAKHPPAPAPLSPPKLTVPLAEAQKCLDERTRLGTDLHNRAISTPNDLADAEKEWYSWGEYNLTLLLKIFSNAKIHDEHRGSVNIFSLHERSFAEAVKEFRQNVASDVRSLSSIRSRLELFEAPSGVVAPASAKPKMSRRVFIAHGRDELSKTELARLLERLDFEAVILHEQPNRGKTIIEKFELYADVGFAVILLTPDDVGGLAGTSQNDLSKRARQNVVFELGFFVGRLGRDRVVALQRPGIEQPSDISGVVYTTLDAGGAWKLELARELAAAGYSVDMSRFI